MGVLQEPQVDLNEVFNKNKITLLTAIREAMRAFEQLHFAVLTELVEVVEGHGGHTAFVRFTWAIHVEISEAGNLRGAIF